MILDKFGMMMIACMAAKAAAEAVPKEPVSEDR